jgi:hypothetical protein
LACTGSIQRRLHVPGADPGNFNVNIAALAQKLDEWAVMTDEALDQHKARALELSRQFDPDVLRPQYEAVLAQ